MPPTPSPTPVIVQIVGGGDGAPWWGVPVIAGGFLILGAALGFWFNWLLEGRRQAVRWDDQLRSIGADIYATVMEIVDEASAQRDQTAGFIDAIGTIEAERQLTQGLTIEEYLERFADSGTAEAWTSSLVRMTAHANRLYALQGATNMLAPAFVRTALGNVVGAAGTLSMRRGNEAQLRYAEAAVYDATQEFIAAMRFHLGVKDSRRSIDGSAG